MMDDAARTQRINADLERAARERGRALEALRLSAEQVTQALAALGVAIRQAAELLPSLRDEAGGRREDNSRG